MGTFLKAIGIIALCMVGGCIALGVIGGLAAKSTGAPATPAAQTVTLDKFNQIQQGMTYEQVSAILGTPGTVGSENTIGGYSNVLYTWTNPGIMGGNMNAMFQNGQLISKAQFGLN